MTSSGTEHAPQYQVFGPHRAGLPPVRHYLRETWQRRSFVREYSRANIRGANSDTLFGTLWLILNPLLLAGVYFIMVNILTGRAHGNPTYFTHLTAALFAFTMVSTCATSGSTSVTTAGKLLLNTNFPRILIPAAAVRTALFRFLPTIPVVLVFQAIAGGPWSWTMLLSLVFLFFMVVFGMGLAAFFATLQVYFRDTQNFLPFIMRLWMYLSPVLWQTSMIKGTKGEGLEAWLHLNPMYAMLTGFGETLQRGTVPPLSVWLIAAGWALVAFVIGVWFFISRERDFAVRVY